MAKELSSDMLMACLSSKRDALGGQGINLFQSALNRSKSDLLELYLRPNLLCPSKSYIYIAEDSGGKRGRPNYDPANSLFAALEPSESGYALPGRWGLFTNPLGWVGIDAAGPRPSDRPINIGFTTYTLEFDELSLPEQLKAIWDGGVRRTAEILSCFKDFRGYEVIYGGAKSLHFHFIFDLRHWSRELAYAGNSSYQEHWVADFPDAYLREAHEDRWNVVRRAFRSGTKIEAEPDPALRFWEQNRRVPLALRRIGDNHPLGLPAGQLVRQYVLASSVRRNIPKSGRSWLHHSNLVGSSALRRSKRRANRTCFESAQSEDAKARSAVEDNERDRFNRFLAENFQKLAVGTDIRFDRAEFDGRGPKLYLYNDSRDQTPSSTIQGDYTNVLLQGRHGFEKRTYPLSVSPNALFTTMVEQEGAFVEPDDHVLSRIFEAEVHDCESYRRFLSQHIVAAISAAALVLILGPEGCGKTSAVMANIDRLADDPSEPIFISSPSYAQAAEKISDFLAMYPDGRYVPFEYFSLSELYQRHCPEGERISELDALEMGKSSWLRTVYEDQPDVYSRMRAHRDELHAIRERGEIPVLFGVHESIRRHVETSMTRLFYSKDFDEGWFDSMPPDARIAYRRHLRFQNVFGHIVLDEVSPSDLVSIHRAPDVRWALAFRNFVQHLPESEKVARYRAFQKFRTQHPRPREEEDWDTSKSDWQYVQEILQARYSDDDQVQLTTERYPFEDDHGIYRDRIGELYYVKPRGWWRGLSGVTLLTTEVIPAQIISALRSGSLADDPEHGEQYRAFRFDRPGIFEDFVHVENHRDCKKSTLPRLVAAYSEEFPRAVVISDMVKNRVDDVRVITHLSSRGSNDLENRDIVSFYTAPSPRLYAQFAALDARFGTRNTIALWYVDRFNQTCGRNRGFRGQHRREHIAVMGYRMYTWLLPYLVTWSRYAFPRRRCSIPGGGRG